MSRAIIYPYKLGSKSAKELSTRLNALRVRADGRYRSRLRDFVINWGSSKVPNWFDRRHQDSKMLNLPYNVGLASNKLKTFQTLQEAGVSIPNFTTDPAVVHQWLSEGATVYARQRLTGHSGAGIIVLNGVQEIPAARLYVRAVENHGEYRVHVFNGEVIDYTKKRRRVEEPATEEQLAVRNLQTGWIYTRGHLRRLERVEELAKSAVSALGLDFGAVDIIMDENGDVHVLEVNTACGMSETTANAYQTAFSAAIGNSFNN